MSIVQRKRELNEVEPSLHLSSWGTARADLAAVAAMRKTLPAWAPKDTPGHFLKHADEQTVLAVSALDQAINAAGRNLDHYRDWAIIAAPRFIGRIAGTATLERFSRGGGPAISPHLIPQHSLHSISGALSILLASRQPNFGVGGTGDSLAEGLLASLTLPTTNCSGVWLVSTGWDPEPQLDDAGQCLNTPICHAVALGFQSAAQSDSCGSLRLVRNGPIETQRAVGWFKNAAGVCRSLITLTPGGHPACFAWRFPWGGTIVLNASEVIAGLAAAA